MKEIVFLLIITVIILGFLSGNIIPLFRDSMTVIGTVADKEYENQKIKSSTLVPLEKNTVTGGDVVGVIRYFSDKADVTVEVIIGGYTAIFTNNTYNPTEFNIPYDKLFLSNYEYMGDKLKRAIYIEK